MLKISKSLYKKIKENIKINTGFSYSIIYHQVQKQKLVMIYRYNKEISLVDKEIFVEILVKELQFYCNRDGENWLRDQIKGLLKI